MGTDIHGVIQVFDKGEWVTSKVMNDSRNYLLFSILAGVRTRNYPYISLPKGLPKGFNLDKYECTSLDDSNVWMGDWGYSYLTLAEIDSYNWNPYRDMCGSFLDQFDEFRNRNPEDVRIVFGFDC